MAPLLGREVSLQASSRVYRKTKLSSLISKVSQHTEGTDSLLHSIAQWCTAARRLWLHPSTLDRNSVKRKNRIAEIHLQMISGVHHSYMQVPEPKRTPNLCVPSPRSHLFSMPGMPGLLRLRSFPRNLPHFGRRSFVPLWHHLWRLETCTSDNPSTMAGPTDAEDGKEGDLRP